MDIAWITGLVLTYRYWILFPIACIEGPIFSFFVGTLAALGYLNPFIAYPILVAGDLIPDTALFYIGRRGKRGRLIEKYASRIGITEGNFAPIQRMWTNHPKKMMVTAKLALGLAVPFLISAGLAGIRPRIYYGVAIPVALLQHIVLIGSGFYFGSSYELVKTYIGHAEFLVISLVVFGAVFYGIARMMKRRFLEEEKSESL